MLEPASKIHIRLSAPSSKSHLSSEDEFTDVIATKLHAQYLAQREVVAQNKISPCFHDIINMYALMS